MTRTKTLRSVEQEQAFFRGMPVREVAERLACTPEHVHDLIREKKLAAINISTGQKKEYRVPVQDFERFVKANAV